MGDGEDRRHARSIVDRAVVNRVSIHDWSNAKMIPVRAVRDVLVAHLRINPAHNPDDVVRGHVLQAVLHRHLDDDARRDRSEIARLRLLAQSRHVEAGL